MTPYAPSMSMRPLPVLLLAQWKPLSCSKTAIGGIANGVVGATVPVTHRTSADTDPGTWLIKCYRTGEVLALYGYHVVWMNWHSCYHAPLHGNIQL